MQTYAAIKSLFEIFNRRCVVHTSALFIISFLPAVCSAFVIKVIDHDTGDGLPYCRVSMHNAFFGTLTDNEGYITLPEDRIQSDGGDTLSVSCAGYKSLREFKSFTLRDTLVLSLLPLYEELPPVIVRPVKKKKTIKYGKKHSLGLFPLFIGNSPDSPVKGQSFGFEIKEKKGFCSLDAVGFHIKNVDYMMSEMKFRINVYDMSRVKGHPTQDFIDVTDGDIIFQYSKEDVHDGKYIYRLEEPFILPEHAMVEIQFLEEMLPGEFLCWNGAMFTHSFWSYYQETGTWDTVPLSTPFFIECTHNITD